METASRGAAGVLSQLRLLEIQARGRNPRQQSRVKKLKSEAEALMIRRDELKAEIQTHQSLQKLRMSMDKQLTREVKEEEEEDMEEDSENSELLQLMARHTQLKDLLHAHHLIGGYDIIKIHQDKGVCVSVMTAFEGVYLDTYNLEIDLKPKLRIVRHNVPPFIPLNSIVEQSDMQSNIQGFLNTLSQHLNAFAGRKQQLKLLKEQHESVEVMESNVLYSILVLMLSVPRLPTAVLCTLDYTDHSRYLPTRVHFTCENEELPDSPEWKKNGILLKETPVHNALVIMRKMGYIM